MRDMATSKKGSCICMTAPFPKRRYMAKTNVSIIADNIGYINIGKIQTDSLAVIFKKFEIQKVLL
jgi:hypothetical protein